MIITLQEYNELYSAREGLAFSNGSIRPGDSGHIQDHEFIMDMICNISVVDSELSLRRMNGYMLAESPHDETPGQISYEEADAGMGMMINDPSYLVVESRAGISQIPSAEWSDNPSDVIYFYRRGLQANLRDIVSKLRSLDQSLTGRGDVGPGLLATVADLTARIEALENPTSP